MGLFGELWDDAKHEAGNLLDDGAHAVGGGLNLLGFHGAAQAVDTEGDKISYDLGGDAPELQLGQTSDPKQLVHGDAGAIRSSASKLKTFATGFGETANGLRQIDTGHWEGAAADAFRAKFATQPAKWSDAAEAMGKASGALESYADTVESAQDQARHAIDLWDQGQQATAQATAAYNQQVSAYNSAAQAYNARLSAGQNPGTKPSQPDPFSDPGEVLRAEARRVLTTARSERDAAGSSAAAAITSATNLAPAEPSFWSQMGDDLSDTFSVGNLASVSFTSGVVEGAAGIVKFARSINPMDQWNMEHPAEYAAGMSGTLAGLADAAINPVDAVKGLVGTGWGSDPAQALGKLVPNVALAVATDGGGAAADAGDMASSVSEDVASQGVTDMTRVGDPVNVATGDVVFTQTDAALPGVLPLVVERVHRSSWRGGRWLGETWASSFDQRLLIAGDRVAAAFADGRVLFWRREDIGGSGGALPTAGPAWPLRRSSGGTYTVTDPQRGLTWRYERRPGFWEYADGQGELPLVSVTNRTGHTIAFSYGADGQPTSITHSGGYRISVVVDGGRVTRLTLDGASGNVPLVRYEYDDAGNLTGVVNSSGQPLRFSYDSAGRMTGWTDRNGHSYRYSYDELGRCVRGESPSGALTGTFSYEPGVTRWADGAGTVTEYRLDRSLRVSAVADPLGGVTRFGHDDRGRVISRTDPLGHETGYGYDDAGNLVSVMRPDGAVARADYDEHSLPVAVTGPDGAAWRQAYDERGNRTSLTAPDGAVTRYGYDDAGHLAEVTGPDGLVTTVACDAAGLLVAGQDPAGRVTRYERDQFGRIGRVIGPDGSITAVAWTVEGRPVSRAFPDGTSETWTWDADGHLIRHVSPSGAVTAYGYGAFDKISAVSWPDGTRSEFGYDHELRTQSVTHGGLAWRYSYDPAGRLTAETDYDGAVTRYSYDAAGQLVRKVNAAGQETLFGYDPLGSLVEQRAGDSVTTFGYDAAGRLVHARNADAELSFARDVLGRVTAETCDGRTVTTSYDMAGRVTGRVTPSGAAASWEYDDAGQPAAMSAGGHELGFRYGPDGRETHRDLPGGVTLTQHWDPRGRLTAQILAGPGAEPSPEGPVVPGHEPTARGQGLTVPGQVLQRRGYRYSPDGFVTGMEDLLTGNRTFGLDAAGRVTEVTGPGWTEQYAYDPVGNVASAAWPVLPPELAGAWLDVSPQGQREVTGTLVSRAGNVRYRHDAAGRVVQRTRTRISRKPETWRYDWNAGNRLVSVTVPDGSVWRYRYDPLGRRIAKQHLDASGQVLGETRFTWDGTVLAEQAEPFTDGSGREQVTTWDYRPGSFAPVTQTSRSSLRDAPQDEIDLRFYAIITDLTGTPSEMVAPDGTLAGYQQHTLWGGTVWHSSGASTPLRFPGQYDDPETGLHYNNQRYYDPVTGAYLSPDPLGLAPAPNPRAYVLNPHVLIDPLGLEPGGVQVYRGTSLVSEQMIHAETSQLMSDAARTAYVESGGSVDAAWAASETAHAAGIEAWGSETDYAMAHGAFGQEISEIGPRSMMSVTTDPAVAKLFAGPAGRVFSAVVDPSMLIPQTLEGAGESEFLIRHMFGAK